MQPTIRETLAPRDLPEPLRAIARTRKRSVYIVIEPEGATHPIESPDWSEGSRTLTALYSVSGLLSLTPEDIPEGCEGGTFPDYDRGEPVALAGRVIVEGGLFRGKPMIATLIMDLATAQAFGWSGTEFASLMVGGERKYNGDKVGRVALAEALMGSAKWPARYRENEERDGVEIAFADKPSAEVREALKGAGFRWSRRLAIWYAKRTPERLALARSIVAEANDPQSESASEGR